MEDCTYSMPFEIGEYTDFYSCKNHALNASKIIRGEDAGLSPNWYSLPVAYNGRKSSVIISGSDICDHLEFELFENMKVFVVHNRDIQIFH